MIGYVGPTPITSRFMQDDGEMLCEEREVLVGCVDRKLPARGNSTDQKIRVGALDALGLASVEEPGCHDIVICCEQKVRESGKVFLQLFELRIFTQTREHLLPDGANDINAVFQNQAM